MNNNVFSSRLPEDLFLDKVSDIYQPILVNREFWTISDFRELELHPDQVQRLVYLLSRQFSDKAVSDLVEVIPFIQESSKTLFVNDLRKLYVIHAKLSASDMNELLINLFQVELLFKFNPLFVIEKLIFRGQAAIAIDRLKNQWGFLPSDFNLTTVIDQIIEKSSTGIIDRKILFGEIVKVIQSYWQSVEIDEFYDWVHTIYADYPVSALTAICFSEFVKIAGNRQITDKWTLVEKKAIEKKTLTLTDFQKLFDGNGEENSSQQTETFNFEPIDSAKDDQKEDAQPEEPEPLDFKSELAESVQAFIDNSKIEPETKFPETEETLSINWKPDDIKLGDEVDDSIHTEPAEQHYLPKLESMISQSQARVFIKSLFSKNESDFYRVLEEFNNIDNWEEAKAHLERTYQRIGVDLYSAEAIKLTDILFSRYQ